MLIAYRFRKLLWYLRRPRLYPHLFYLLSKKLLMKKRSPLNDTRQESTLWCASHALDTNSAIQKITGLPIPKLVAHLFPDTFALAHRQVAGCPVEMGGSGDVDLIFWLAEYVAAQRVVETGVAYGWSSLAFLLSLRNRSGSLLISTDMPYPGLNNDQYVGCVVPTELRSNWRILRYADRQALPKALKKQDTIDMCHYDSDKSYEGKLWAYPLLWKYLRTGGIMISDDIGDNIAFRDFSRFVSVDPIVVACEGKYIGVLIKPSEY